mgnify:CR=1 FL=1
MSARTRWVLARYAEAEPLLAAARALRQAGHASLDIHSPYPLPGSDEALLFFQGPMSSQARTQVMHHGYALTLAALRETYPALAGIFARHGIATTADRLHAEPPEMPTPP